jgi:hypothetical protein
VGLSGLEPSFVEFTSTSTGSPSKIQIEDDGSFAAPRGVPLNTLLNDEEDLLDLEEILDDCEEMFLKTHTDTTPESRFIDKVPRGAQLDALRHGKVEAVLRDNHLNTAKNVVYSSTPDFENYIKTLEGDWHKVFLNGDNFAAIRRPQNMPDMDWVFLVQDVAKALEETMSDEDRQKLKDAKVAKATGSNQAGNSSDQRPNSQMKGKGGGGGKKNYDRSKRTANFDDDESQHYRRDTGGFGGQAESRQDQFHSFENEVERETITDGLLKRWDSARTKLGSVSFDPSHWLSRVHMDKEYHIPVPKDAFNQITLANLNRAVKHPLFNLISVTDQRTVTNSIAGSVKLANKADRDAKAKDPKKKVSEKPKKKPSKAPGKQKPKKAVKLESPYLDLTLIPPRVTPESRIVEGELITKNDRACLIAIHSAVDGRFISMGFRFTSECYLTTMHTFTNVPGIKNFVFGGGFPKSKEYVMSCLKDGVVNGTDEYATFDFKSNVVTTDPMSANDLDYTGLAIIHGTKHPKGVKCGKLDVSAEKLPGIILVVNPVKPGSEPEGETPGNIVEHGRRLFAHLSPTFCDRGSSGLPIKGLMNDGGICGMHVGSEAVIQGIRQNLAIDLMSAASRVEVENLLSRIPPKN